MLLAAPHHAPAAQTASASDDVSAGASRLAREIAERTPVTKARRGDRVVFIGTDLIRRKGSEGVAASALHRVTHYRYRDDTAVVTLVDLATRTIVRQVERQHAPVALSAGELAEAKALALGDGRVVSALGSARPRIVMEPLVVRTVVGDPWFDRRVVRLLFKLDTDYLTEPTVFVDLTARSVIIHPRHGHK